MGMTGFHTLRQAVQDNSAVPSTAALSLMSDELTDVLTNSGMFDEVEVGITDNPDALVIALCRFHAHLDAGIVAGRLEQLWHDRLRYPFWEAHTTLVHPGHVELEGATRSSSAGHYATMHVVAQRATVPAQRAPSV